MVLLGVYLQVPSAAGLKIGSAEGGRLHVGDGGRDIFRECGCGCEEMLSYVKVKCSKHSREEMAVCCVRVEGHIAQGGVDEGDCGPGSALNVRNLLE